jgi:hypothetical protein
MFYLCYENVSNFIFQEGRILYNLIRVAPVMYAFPL